MPEKYIIYRSKLGCRVTPYKRRQSRAIEYNTAIYDKVYHRWNDFAGFCLPYGGKISYLTYNRDYDDLAKMFPRYEIESMEPVKSDYFSSPIKMINIESLRESQIQIVREMESKFDSTNVWFINLQTGQGKTILATYISTILNLKTWVLCFSDEILSQWYETFASKTTIQPEKIMRVTGSLIDKILAGEINPEEYDVFMCTPTLLDRFGNSRSDYSRINDLFNLCKIGFMIYDEAHRNVSNLVKINAIMDIKYQMYLSADFGQGDYYKENIYKQIFKNVPVLTPTKELQLSMKYTKLVAIKFNTHPSAIEEREPFNKYGYNPELYMKYEFKKGILVDAIMYVLENFSIKNLQYRTLILFYNIEHVDIMYNLLKEKYPDVLIGRYYGGLSKEEKNFAKNKANITVATYSSFSTGLDAKNIKYVLSTNQCNKVMDNQSAGRARPLEDGSDAMYFMFVDTGFTYCVRKLKIRLQYLTVTKAKDDNPYTFTYHPDMHKGVDNT